MWYYVCTKLSHSNATNTYKECNTANYLYSRRYQNLRNTTITVRPLNSLNWGSLILFPLMGIILIYHFPPTHGLYLFFSLFTGRWLSMWVSKFWVLCTSSHECIYYRCYQPPIFSDRYTSTKTSWSISRIRRHKKH